ncbi:MAG: CHAT domain-containing protein [Burkholderiales bacterium]
MIPGSAMTRALASCDALPTDRLYVIAGDAAAQGLKGVFTLIADVFYGWHDHDYVVHTKSMFGGFRRTAIAPLSLRLEDAAVSHFAYFGAGSDARNALMKALAGGIEGFNPLGDDERRTRGQRGALQLLKSNPLSRRRFPDWLSRVGEPAHTRQPVVIVLAGIMGSELARRDAQADNPVWLSARAMLGGQLAELALNAGDLLPTGLLAYGYERLIEAADERFNVLPVPFDWRQPIAVSGGRLRENLKQVLASIDPGLPVHLIAHSMGGLVARHALFVDDSDKGALWRTLSRRGGRLLQLGTPNRGAYAPAILLLGQHSLANALGLFASKVSGSDLSQFGAGFQGLLEMLPQSNDEKFDDLFDIRNWERIAQVDSRLAKPDPDVLKQAAAYVRSDAFVRSLDALKNDTNVLYVAGQGETPMQMRERAPRFGDELPGMREVGIEFLASPQGDGTVSWSSRLAPERTWYAPCEHGTLPDDTDFFEAYFELLQDGQTRRLTSQPPQTRGAGADQLRPLRAPPQPSLLPTDEDLAAMLAPAAAPGSQGEAIAIRIVHGGLDYARFPLMVGHYLNEHVTGAARRVDEKLGGQFQRVLDLKLFVGAARTAHYLRPNNHGVHAPAYPGAIMLGLGSVGELTPASLADTVARGVLRYVFEHLHRDPFSPGAQEPVDIRLSSVLAGTHTQAVSVRDSLAGLLRGVWRAAQMMPGLGSASRPVRIRELELIEIDETTALDAAYELRQLLERGEWSTRFDWAAGVLETRQGHQRGYRTRTGRSTWQRLVVRQDSLGGLNFALIGSQARVEATQVYSDVSSLRRYLDRISDGRSQASDRITSSTDTRLGSVLFQLLLPNDLKSRLANLDNTVLVLDDQTAAYPWELLTPPQEALGKDDAPRPFAVQAGLVRQRVTAEFRLLPQMQEGFRALVIGAPSTGGWVDEKGSTLRFGDLPGARAEAQMVRDLLDRDTRTWVVVPEASTGTAAFAGEAVGFEHIRTLLLEQPYRLLHLCGHGVVDHWVRQIGSGSEARALRKSGMVLSNQELLGAVDVEQMSTTPEFVFINCCYSGKDGDAGSGTVREASGGQRAALAASLALKFIDLGAKAVIAAGWQVDDTAALQFAKMFYENLLSGIAFGEAARTARSEIHARYGKDNNTWGAYQCYGDPSWTLAAGSGLARQGASGPQETSCLDGAERTMSVGELATRIAQLQAVAGDEPAANVCRRIDGLLAALAGDPRRRDWLRDSRVRTELGLAYRELGEHKLAAQYLQMSARSTYSELRIGDLEKLVNSLARVSDPADPREGTQARAAAEALLAHLNRLGKSGAASWPLESGGGTPSSPREPRAASERLSLLGSVRLRAAAELLENVQASPKVAPLLRKAVKAFAQSFRRKLREGDALDRRNYALSNALLAAALLQTIERNAAQPRQTLCDALGALEPVGNAAGERDAQAIVSQWLSQASDHLDEVAASANRSTFWNYATAIELRTARGLFAYAHNDPSYKVKQVEADIEFVRDGIDRICALWPSPNDLDSMRHRFRLIKLVEAQFGGAEPGGMMSLVAKLAVEANDRLQLRAREVG